MAEKLCVVDVYFTLVLNDMRDSKIEYRREFGKFETVDEAKAVYEQEKVEYYKDGHWGKCFRAGGPLEWANPTWGELELMNIEEVGRPWGTKPDCGIVEKVSFVRFVD